jgi:hypothetical protein
VLPLDTLADKPPEPMTREDFVAVLKHVRGSMDTFVTLEKKDVKRMLDEIRWLKRRLRRVEYVLERGTFWVRAPECRLVIWKLERATGIEPAR